MAVTEEIMKQAGNLENIRNWKSWMPHLTPIGYAYRNGEARRYYRDKRGGYWYRVVTEAEMHRRT